jgi:hypothetical protein
MKTDVLESFSEISKRLKDQQQLVRKIEIIMRYQDWSLISLEQLRLRSNRLKDERLKLAIIKAEMYTLVETVILPKWVSDI